MTRVVDHDLTPVKVLIGEVRPHPENYREADVGALSVSIDAHGQYAPLIVQRATGHILAGNHRWKAMRALGRRYCWVIYLDVDDDQALQILVADNRTSDLATNDVGRLAQVAASLATRGLLEGTGLDGEDVDRLVADAHRIAAPVLDPDAPGPAGAPDTTRDRDRDRPQAAGRSFAVTFTTDEELDAWTRLVEWARETYPADTTGGSLAQLALETLA